LQPVPAVMHKIRSDIPIIQHCAVHNPPVQATACSGREDCHARGYFEGQRPGIFIIVMNRFFRGFPSIDCVRMTKTCHSEGRYRRRPTKSLKQANHPNRTVQVSALEPALTAQCCRLHPLISYRGAWPAPTKSLRRNRLVTSSCCYCIKSDRTSQLFSIVLFTTLRTRQNACSGRGTPGAERLKVRDTESAREVASLLLNEPYTLFLMLFHQLTN